jgi:hypothetical protein
MRWRVLGSRRRVSGEAMVERVYRLKCNTFCNTAQNWD